MHGMETQPHKPNEGERQTTLFERLMALPTKIMQERRTKKTAEKLQVHFVPTLNIEGVLHFFSLPTDSEASFPEFIVEKTIEQLSHLMSHFSIKDKTVRSRVFMDDFLNVAQYFHDRTYIPPEVIKDIPLLDVETVDTPQPEKAIAIFFEQEERSPDPNDVYALGVLTDSEEKKLAAYAKTAEVESRRYSRETLLIAGFAAVNRYANWEKPLFEATIDGTNFAEKNLLTQADLDTLKEYQHSQGILDSEVSNSEIISDMIQFIYAANAITAQGSTRAEVYRMASRNCKLRLNDAGRSIISAWESAHGFSSEDEWETQYNARDQLSKTFFRDLFPWIEPAFMVGIPLRGNYATTSFTIARINSLNALHSPLLDSGFTFYPFPEVQLNMVRLEDEAELPPAMRINLMVIHLANHGLSELGKGQGWDQHYATISEYMEHVFTTDEKVIAQEKAALTKKYNEEQVKHLFEQRLLAKALEWAETQPELKLICDRVQRKGDDQLPDWMQEEWLPLSA